MKNILITGCSSGFGNQASKYLAEKGHQVYATMRGAGAKNKEAADDLRKVAQSDGLKIEVVELDVTSDNSVYAAMRQIPQIDVLINNAGYGQGGPLETLSCEQVSAQFEVNVLGIHRVTNAVLPGMRAQKSGLIINLSSVAGRFSGPGFGIYHASKWAVEAMSEALRYEVGPLGIDVAMVEPGPFSTQFFPNVAASKSNEIASAYAHVADYFQGFGQTVMDLFADENAPTDPMIIVKIFEDLINAPAGKRPLRTLGGLDFGASTLNESYESFRQTFMEQMQIEGFDGAKS